MKITKTLVVAGLLAFGGTAANAGYVSFGDPSFASYYSKIKDVKDSYFDKLYKRYDRGESKRKDRRKDYKFSEKCKRMKCKPGGGKPKYPKPDVVPLPAGGLLLLGGLGVLALQRRRKV